MAILRARTLYEAEAQMQSTRVELGPQAVVSRRGNVNVVVIRLLYQEVTAVDNDMRPVPLVTKDVRSVRIQPVQIVLLARVNVKRVAVLSRRRASLDPPHIRFSVSEASTAPNLSQSA